jgi:hypothetical protein
MTRVYREALMTRVYREPLMTRVAEAEARVVEELAVWGLAVGVWVD